jgi:hypothetical protein
MKFTRIIAVAGAIIASAAFSRASWDEPPGVYFARERGQVVSTYGALPKRISKNNDIPLIIAEARKQGVPERLALKVCKIESGCRLHATGPRTKHGHHYGAFQIRPSSAARFGYTGGSLQGLPGLRYGMAHLADCYRRAGGSESLAARCHISGPGGISGKRLAPWAERYAQRYTRQVVTASPPTWAGTLPYKIAMRVER